jgi:hypothetical protein
MEEVSKYLPLLCGVFLVAVLLFYNHLNSDCSWNLFPLLLCAYVFGCLRAPRMEVGSNTSTVALQVVEGDVKGTQCLGV